MDLVRPWNDERNNHEEHDEVAEQEVGPKKAKLCDFAQEFASWLRHRVPSHAVPFAGPPSNVCGVTLEFPCEGQGNDQLVNEALNGNGSDDTNENLGETETFENHEDLEEYEQDDDRNSVSNRSKDRPELLTADAEDRTHAACATEKTSSNASVDSNRRKGDDSNPDQGVTRLDFLALILLDWLPGSAALVCSASLCVDIQVRDQCCRNEDQRRKDITPENVAERSSRSIRSAFVGRFANDFALVSSDTSTRETDESNP